MLIIATDMIFILLLTITQYQVGPIIDCAAHALKHYILILLENGLVIQK